MDWNERYVEGDMPWEKGCATPVLGEIWERLGKVEWQGGRVLVPGCGFGYDARWLAEKGLEVVGLDIAELAVEGARERTKGGNPRFEVGSFFEVGERVGMIFEHTCFCAIEPADRARYAEAASGWLASGGLLVAVHYSNPENGGEGPPHGCSREELDGLFGDDFELLDEWVPGVAFEGREGRELVRLLRRK